MSGRFPVRPFLLFPPLASLPSPSSLLLERRQVLMFLNECRITYAELNELKEGKMDWRFSEPGRMAPPGSSPVVKMEGLPV